MKNTKRGCSTCNQQKSERIVESFEEFTGKQSRVSVGSVCNDIVTNLQDLTVTTNKYGGDELRWILLDGSYLYFIFIKQLGHNNIKDSMLRMFNPKGGGLADIYMEGIRSCMREETDSLYDIIQCVGDNWRSEDGYDEESGYKPTY
jgi:hypothetical protein